MFFTLALSFARSVVAHVLDWAFDRLIRQPLAGIQQLATGLIQTVVPLAAAASRTVVATVRACLTPPELVAVKTGLLQVQAGLVLLAWPLMLGSVVLFWNAPLVVQLLVGVAMLGVPLG